MAPKNVSCDTRSQRQLMTAMNHNMPSALSEKVFCSLFDFVRQVNERIKVYWYEVYSGNNPKLIHRVMLDSGRRSYWKDISNSDDITLFRNQINKVVCQGPKETYTACKVNFKWSPCSIKQDFEKL